MESRGQKSLRVARTATPMKAARPIPDYASLHPGYGPGYENDYSFSTFALASPQTGELAPSPHLRGR